MKWNLDAERELWRAICAPNRWFDKKDNPQTHPESLWWFIHLAWGSEFYFKAGNRRWLVPRVHKPYLQWLQNEYVEWKLSRKSGNGDRWYVATVIPRAFGKTVTTTKAAPLWNQLDEPDMSSIIGSATEDLALDILKSIKFVINGENEHSWFRWLYGDWSKAGTWTKRTLTHAYRRTAALSEPSFDTTAVGIGMTGYHPLHSIWDDPIIANKLREGGTYLETCHTAFDATYPAVTTDGWIQMVLTRYEDDDVAGRHFLEEGVKSWNGMDCPDMTVFSKYKLGEGRWRVYFLQAENELTGDVTLPEVMPRKEIEIEKAKNPEDFACQYQNNPGTSELAPLLDWQIRDCFMDYEEFRTSVPINYATIHLDTAFKRKETIGKGDYNAIVPFYHDSRPNGLVYLDADLLVNSNRLRGEDFEQELLRILHKLQRRRIWVKCITDEKETYGKEGTFHRQITAAIKATGLEAIRIHQFPRQGTVKDTRIRQSASMWAAGYVRIVLRKDANGNWIIPDAAYQLFRQMTKIGATAYRDLADAASDVWQKECWTKPNFSTMPLREEGMTIRVPADSDLRAMSRPFTNDELRALMDGEDFVEQLGPGRGSYDGLVPRDPV